MQEDRERRRRERT